MNTILLLLIVLIIASMARQNLWRCLESHFPFRKNRRVLLQKGHTSKVSIEKVVVKQMSSSKYDDFKLLEREACVLKILHNFTWAPRLLRVMNKSIMLSHVGHVVTAANLPSDYSQQFNQILVDMASVGVRHNDILYPCTLRNFLKNSSALQKGHKHEVMVKDGRLSLIDFGWSTVNDAVPCGVSKDIFPPIWNKTKRCDDFQMLQVLNGFSTYSLKSYRDPKRVSGSQSEIPYVRIGPDFHIRVRGYQKYEIKDHRVVAINSYPRKFEWLREALGRLRSTAHTDTFMDIGCNTGLTSLLAYEEGYKSVTSLDHDEEAIAVLKKVVSQEHIDVIQPLVFSFGEAIPTKADVVFVGALIHWVFTCTADFGRFDLIIAYLMTAAPRVLIVEWVDPEDPAIKSFHHTDCGTVSHEQYEVAAFERSLMHVGNIVDKWPVTHHPTRVIYTVLIHRSPDDSVGRVSKKMRPMTYSELFWKHFAGL